MMSYDRQPDDAFEDSTLPEPTRPIPRKLLIRQEAERCALAVYYELTGGAPRPEFWYPWYLCERHGGPPLLVRGLPRRQIAFWDGEDIVIDASAPLAEIVAALPEELTHRLSSRETPRFEWLNATLHYATEIGRADFQEMVGQRVADLFLAARHAPRR